MNCKRCKEEVEKINDVGICLTCHNQCVKEAKELFKAITGAEAPEEEVPFENFDAFLNEKLSKKSVEELEILKSLEDILPTPKEMAFKFITNEMNLIYTQKNHDYGDSFGKQFEKYGLQSSVIRLSDKFSRLEKLATAENKVKDESIIDTLLDMANYCIMTIIEMNNK